MLTILHTEASDGWGGQEIRVVQEAAGMIRRGYRVIIATHRRCKIFDRAGDAGITVFSANFQKKNPASVIKMLSFINREKVDIVNTHSSSDSWVTTIASRLSRARPLVIRTRHLSTPISKSYLSRLIYDRLTDAIITAGEEIKRMMINENRFDASKIFSIPTGVDLERFNPQKVKPAFQLKNPPPTPLAKGGKGGFENGGQGGLIGGFSIGMVGVLRSWKGHRFFIEAIPEIIKSIPEAVFYIVGDGPQYGNIKNLINNLSLQDRVFMLGHREDIPEVLASLHVVVHPSYANEGIPQSILQAMAMEKAVIASDAGAIKEVVMNGKTGFLIEPGNPRQLAEKVIVLHKDSGLMTEFGKEGRRIVGENYSFEKMLDKTESLYSFLLNKKNLHEKTN